MNDEKIRRGSPARRLSTKVRTSLRRLWRLLRPESAGERYLAAATDHADLERRIRDLERTNRGPAFVTFNH